MPPSPDRALQKVTMNFYADDVAFLQRKHGNGWSSEIREMVSNKIKEEKRRVINVERD